MWGTIANLRENLDKIAVDVHHDEDNDEMLRTYGGGSPANGDDSAVSDRRNSNGFARSKSGIRSPLANGIDHVSPSEVTLSPSRSCVVCVMAMCMSLFVVCLSIEAFNY